MGQDTGGACDMDASDTWSQHLEEIGDRLNQQDGDRMGFLRMVNRNHVLNCSNYSLSSLFRYIHHMVTTFTCSISAAGVLPSSATLSSTLAVCSVLKVKK
jgi:hypothetical protein